MPGELDRAFVNGSAQGGNQSNAANIPAIANARGYCTGIAITVGGATAAGNFVATLTNVIGGTRNIPVNVQAGVNTPPEIHREAFSPPLKGIAVNTQIVITLPALGAGNVVAGVEIEGFTIPEP